MGSSKRIEVEILGWVKFIFDMACGVLITVYYIIKEFVEMILKTKSKSLAGKHVLVSIICFTFLSFY
ncbi:hypothetical protein O3M35_006057 [Rhynocoris fuscipes]|uniref:Uncharacterized protein n=1 Tax=Rhynocoris fuscipes TaxID=488301 RepID=A0AAW1DDK8_9HEMI